MDSSRILPIAMMELQGHLVCSATISGASEMTIHVPDHKSLDPAELAQIFTEARTHNVFLDRPVSDELLHKAVHLAKMGPTSANQSPMRILFLRSEAAKERLRPGLAPGNLAKTMAAPVVAL